MSDALDGRTALPEAHRWLLETFPRLRWHDPALGEVARFWLQMHAGFRQQQAQMQAQVARWRTDGDSATLHSTLIPMLQGFLQHLDGHHRVESGHYFPVMRRVEPRITTGIDLLDADHDAIHGHLDALFQSPLSRHLEDEEDIVIPLITRHADAFAH